MKVDALLLLILAVLSAGVASENVDGQWSEWTTCDLDCDGGLRGRYCVWNPKNPPTASTCPQDGIEAESCNVISCDTGEPLEQEGFTSWTSWTADPKNAKQLVRNRSCKNEDLGCDGYLDETLVVSDIISSSVTKKKVPRVSGKRSGGKKKKEIVAGTIEKGQVKPALSEWQEVSQDGKYVIEEFIGKGQFVKEVAADWNAWGAWKRAPDGTLTSKRTCKNAPKGPCRGQDLRRKRKQPKVFRREGMYDVEVQTGVQEVAEDWEEYGQWALQEDGTYTRTRKCKNTDGPCRGYSFQRARLAKIELEKEVSDQEYEYDYEDELSFNSSRSLQGKRGKKHKKKPQATPLPTQKPTTQKPTTQPTTLPATQKPTTQPATQPTTLPTTQKPTTQPTTLPATQKPTTQPATQPTTLPTTQKPTTQPTTHLTTLPKRLPTTQKPTTQPAAQPTTLPTTQKPTQPTTQPKTKKLTQPITQPITQPTTQKPTTQPTTQKPTTQPTPQKSTTKLVTKPTTQKPKTKPTTVKEATQPTRKPTTKTKKPVTHVAPLKTIITTKQPVLQPIIIPIICGGLDLPCNQRPEPGPKPCREPHCIRKKRPEPEAFLVPGSLIFPLAKKEKPEKNCSGEEDESDAFASWLDTLEPPSSFVRKGLELPPGCTVIPTQLLKHLLECDCIRHEWMRYESGVSGDFFHEFYGRRRPQFGIIGRRGGRGRGRPQYDDYNYSYEYEDFDYGRRRRPRHQK